MRPSIASVVVAAHQEEATIERGLCALLADAEPGELDLVVVANGCTDATAARARDTARRLRHDVRVLELPIAGKAAAIRAAERLDLPLPRVFVDADVECETGVVRQLVAALGSKVDLAVPARALDLAAASAPTRSYYRVWSQLPWVRDQLTGRGVLAVSEGLRSRYEELPDVVADDRFITTRVPRDRAVIIQGAVRVRPPTRLRDVVRVRRRVYRGNRGAEVPAHDVDVGRRASHLGSLLLRPGAWPGLVLFTAVTAAAKVPWPSSSGWGRDQSRGGAA